MCTYFHHFVIEVMKCFYIVLVVPLLTLYAVH